MVSLQRQGFVYFVHFMFSCLLCDYFRARIFYLFIFFTHCSLVLHLRSYRMFLSEKCNIIFSFLFLCMDLVIICAWHNRQWWNLTEYLLKYQVQIQGTCTLLQHFNWMLVDISTPLYFTGGYCVVYYIYCN